MGFEDVGRRAGLLSCFLVLYRRRCPKVVTALDVDLTSSHIFSHCLPDVI